jgi:cytosine/adenosine deaminase-related metal-dependent hydrolase
VLLGKPHARHDRAHGVRHGPDVHGKSAEELFEPTDDALMRADEMVSEFNGALDGRLKAWFSIRVPVAMSDDLLRRLGRLAEKRGVGGGDADH